jgi:hypothetical protein
VEQGSGFVPGGGTSKYPLNALGVIRDWRGDSVVRVAEECQYRDYWRLVLTRPGQHGDDRLYLDPKTGYPVKLDRRESHFLWGQVHVEYLYTLWGNYDGVYFPRAIYRMVDGEVKITRTIGKAEVVAREAAPGLTLPDLPAPAADQVSVYLQATPPDTFNVAPDTYLLVNPGYTEAVALVNDTVFVFDATQGEARARQDEAWANELFQGEYPVVVIVTDLAWPHIGGVRYWVARGATIVSHRISEDFLRRVVERRWTLAPDLLEERREEVAFNFIGIDQAHSLGGGGVQLAPIDGIGSEGALIAYLPRQRFLWAGDFIQRTDQPTAYTTEVWQAAERAGFEPLQTAAQHLQPTPWATIEALQQPDGGAAEDAQR